MKIAIDLLWVKPNKSGGIEAYIRNLLDGFLELDEDNEYVLLVSKDNYTTFDKYYLDNRFDKIVCNVNSSEVIKRILWQNIILNRILKNNNLNICFEPIYSKPLIGCKKIKYITTIHDLQALHYPQYFSKLKNYWMRFSWKRTIKTSDKVIAISKFVKEDIIKNYDIKEEKIDVIYNPIVLEYEQGEFEKLSQKYKVDSNNYYYTVAQLLPHKNLETLILLIKEVKEKEINITSKLLITGINGKSAEKLYKMIEEYNLSEDIILTGYINNDERNCLYKNCRVFLFPSIFEGFGMPPVEAMMMGADVITTKKTSIYEVTNGLANYVDDPYDVAEWIELIKNVNTNKQTEYDCLKSKYDKVNIAKAYLDAFKRM